jgi:spore coat protein SA
MRVVHIGTDRLPCPPEYGGAIETYVYEVSKELARRGIDIHLITLGESYQTFTKDGMTLHTFPTETLSGRFFFKAFSFIGPNRNVIVASFAISKILQEIEKEYGMIDIIHAHYFTTGIAPIVWRTIRNRSTKLVFHWHNEPKPTTINKMMMGAQDMIFAVSNYVKRAVIRNLDVNPSKVKTIYNCVNADFFKYESSWRERIRNKFGLKEDHLVLLFVGRIVPEKGLLHAVRALKELENNTKLFVVGPSGEFDQKGISQRSEYHRSLIEFIRNYNLVERVLFLGKVRRIDLPKIYCASDIVVVPSIWEDPCPSVVLEGMACQRPVIAYSTGGIPELINHGKTGYLIPKRSIPMLSMAIKTLSDEKLRLVMGKEARKLIIERFSSKKVADIMLNFYQILKKVV